MSVSNRGCRGAPTSSEHHGAAASPDNRAPKCPLGTGIFEETGVLSRVAIWDFRLPHPATSRYQKRPSVDVSREIVCISLYLRRFYTRNKLVEGTAAEMSLPEDKTHILGFCNFWAAVMKFQCVTLKCCVQSPYQRAADDYVELLCPSPFMIGTSARE